MQQRDAAEGPHEEPRADPHPGPGGQLLPVRAGLQECALAGGAHQCASPLQDGCRPVNLLFTSRDIYSRCF